VKLTVFQAGKGDCLLLQSKDGKNILVDGGVRDAYRTHVAPALGALEQQGEVLDLVYLSHIDDDHIAGVLQLMDDHVAWRVYDFQQKSGNTTFEQPKQLRPPKVKNLWHNPFHEAVSKNTGPIEDMLATRAGILELSNAAWAQTQAQLQRELATSVAEGIELSRRVRPEQLNIKVNRPFGGKLAFARQGANPIGLGSLKITVIGPFPEDLAVLRKEWNAWLEDNQEQLDDLRRSLDRDTERLHATEFEQLRGWLTLATTKLGDRSKVTAPNLASLMLLVEEDSKTVLLTGDGHHADILKGLALADKLSPSGGLHVDVLKVQHHGSEHNLDEAFARKVTADHYVFCADGEHQNPDTRVVRALLDSRLGQPSKRSTNHEVSRPFVFHFNSSSQSTEGADNRAVMRAVERQVKNAASKSAGQLTFSFLKGASSFELKVG
jgi:beta-lactamase superfamily II metal-dependent hydrolase